MELEQVQRLITQPSTENDERLVASWDLDVTTHALISYTITHTAGHVFDLDNSTLAELVDARPALVVVDRTVLQLYGSGLIAYLTERLSCKRLLCVDGLECRKDWNQVERVCSEAVECGLRRDGVIIGVGGGVVLDLVGVAASLYRRGTRYVRIPTTLVGLVDVAIGIKHGINFKSKKNALGAFFPPFGCINDITFLKTLPERQLACGLAEILKMAIVRDDVLFDLLLADSQQLLRTQFQCPAGSAREILFRAESAMLSELQTNLFEHDLRRLVDFGHTFSATLEAETAYEVGHGEAVAIDMLLSTSIAVELGICPYGELVRLMHLYELVGLPIGHALFEPDLLWRAMEQTRAHRGGNLNLVVPRRIGGATFLQDVKAETIMAAFSLIAHSKASMRS